MTNMTQSELGGVIRSLREKANMTQSELGDRLGVTDKTVSKWETGNGFPDITLLEPIANVFSVSVSELISGDTVKNDNVSGNLLRTNFYICPVCRNLITAVGSAVVACHGVTLLPSAAKKADAEHTLQIENVEDEYYVSSAHPMTKEHNISFISAVGGSRIETVKLYPEGACEARFSRRLVKKIYFYCNKDGLYYISPSDYKQYNLR